ncbi:MAG: AMP-binding protein [Ilumatobacteraceae bacterium]
MTITKQGRTSSPNPYPLDGIERGGDGVLRYTILPPSIVAMLRTRADADPAAEAIVEVGGARLTYRELWDAAARVAGGLRASGVAGGDRVAIRLPNGADWVVAFFGCLLAGAVAVPVNTRFSEHEVDHVVADSGASVVISTGTPLPAGTPFAFEDGRSSDLAAIFYTSGTTGFPKGAMLPHSCFLATCENRVRVTGTAGEPALRNLVSVPLFHVTGCCSQLMFTLWCGGTTVIMPAFSVQPFLHALVDERINIATSVPAIWWLAINQPNFASFDTRGLRHLSYGGAPMAPELVGRVRSAFPNAHLGNGFGLTETTAIATFLPDAWCASRPETVGFPAPVTEVDLFEPDPATGVGELLVRGQNVVDGYWNAPERTAETFVDGWLHTGDLARIDADGFVQIVDRLKDMVNRGGENVYCVEVENALVQHPDVFEVAVLGVPDPMMGEKVGAVIVPRPGSALSGAAIRSWALEQIADFKVPQFVVVRDEPLPRNPGGKVLKPTLRETIEWGDQLR